MLISAVGFRESIATEPTVTGLLRDD